MSDRRCWFLAIAVTAFIMIAWPVSDARAAGRIVCWKDENGKVLGCGDRIPQEYRQNATKELDSRGVTRKTTETPEEAARRRAEAEQRAKEQAEERRRVAEEKRQDRALLATYANAQEIDNRRDRELEQVEAQIRQLDVSLKNLNERRADLEKRLDVARNDKYLKGGVPELEKDLEKISAERDRLVQRIAHQETIKGTIRARFDEQKQRFRTLKGETSAPATRSTSN